MTIRFLDVVESDAPGFPFVPGQVVSLPRLSETLQAAIRQGYAEILRDQETETPRTRPVERAVTRRRRAS